MLLSSPITTKKPVHNERVFLKAHTKTIILIQQFHQLLLKFSWLLPHLLS